MKDGGDSATPGGTRSALPREPSLRLSSAETDPNPASEDDYGDAMSQLMIPTRFRFLTDTPAPSSLDLLVSGPLALAHSRASEFVVTSDPEHLRNGKDGILLNFCMEGSFKFEQNLREGIVSAGNIAVVHAGMFQSVTANGPQSSRFAFLSDAQMRPLVGDLSRFAGMVLGPSHPEIMLLSRYVAALDFTALAGQPTVGALVSRQITDLLAAGMARVSGREDPTEGHGVRAVRLSEILRMIDDQLTQPTLNALRVARRLGVSERYVQKLLEETGTTFSALVMEKRLVKAFRNLSEDRDRTLSVREIGWAAGFSDPSHFNRAFRRRFGETPGGVRGTGRAH